MLEALPRVKAPEGPRGAGPAPRQRQKKSRFLVFKNVDEPDIREIVQSITNGLDASLVAPELYPQIINQLKAQELNLKYSNPCASASLHEAIQYIMNWKPEEEPAPVEPREDIYMPSQEMMDEGIELAMEGKDLGTIDPRLLQLLIAPLREIRLTALQNDDYKLAQKAEQGTRNVVAQQTLQLKIEEQDEKMSEQQQRLEIAQIQLVNVKEKWDILIEQRKQQMEEDLQNRQAEFLVSLEEFDQQFQKEPPPKVLKLSPTALDLKAKERFLVSSKRFDEAKKMRAMANLRERQEIKSKKEQYYKNLLKEREKLIEKEKQKEFVVEMNWQSNIIQMQMNANKEITHAQKTVDHLISLTKSLETESVMSKTARKLPPLNISKGNNISTMNTIR